MIDFDYFPQVIGQQRAKSLLGNLIRESEVEGYVPPIIITAPKGSGKTLIANIFSQHVSIASKQERSFVEINCSTLKNLAQFWEQIVVKYIEGKNVTIFFDEASEIPRDVSFALLTILEPKDNYCSEYTYGETTVNFDLRKITWIFATSEPQELFHALFDRLRNIDLEDYSQNDLGEIIKRFLELNGVTCELDAVLEAGSTCRGNARSARRMGMTILSKMKSLKTSLFDIHVWRMVQKSNGINPLGLEPREILLLKHLKTYGNCSLTRLASMLGLTPDSVRRSVEVYLLKLNFIQIAIPAGRIITKSGLEYLNVNNL